VPTHLHLLLTPTARHIEHTIRWIKSTATRAVHDRTIHTGPVWSRGRWCGFIFDQRAFDTVRSYIGRHRTHHT
jgi:hypothetical protein